MKHTSFFLLILLINTSIQMDCTYDPAYQTEEVDMTACQLAASKGIPFEVHNDVITDDGYILTLHRLPNNDTKRRYPVLLMHGLLQSSDVWLLNERNVSLAWVLWDQGYDVWMGNFRGNFYSRNHTQYAERECEEEVDWIKSYYQNGFVYVEKCTTKITNPDKFWAFSFDEMGRYDVPAMVDRITMVTGRKKVNYVGHSQGCVALFSAVAQLNHQFREKINKFFAFAPAALISKMSTEYGYFLDKTNIFFNTLKAVSPNEIFPRSTDGIALALYASTKYICSYMTNGCTNLIFDLAGESLRGEFDSNRLEIYLKHDPSGTSFQNLNHWEQMKSINLTSNDRRRNKMGLKFYDFESEEANMAHYNQTTPPYYDLSAFNIPTYFFCGTQDALVVYDDCKTQAKEISKYQQKLKFYKVNGYSHADFLYGTNTNQKIYSRIIREMD